MKKDSKDKGPVKELELPKITSVLSTYEDAFELTGHGKFSYVALLSCCFVFMYCALEMTGIAYIITPAECDLHFSVLEKSLINCSVFIGIMSTAICWGSFSDRYGRRRIMLPALLATMLASFLSSLCTTFWIMFTLRLITGFLVSASSATVLVYLSELHTNKYRDTAISIVITVDQFNTALIPVMAWIILPGKWSFELGPLIITPWRVFMWFWAFPGLMGAALLFILPESPRFLLASKGSFSALPILATMYAWNHNKSQSDFPVTSMSSPSKLTLTSNHGLLNVAREVSWLLRPPMLRCFLISHFCMFIIYILTNGLYMWMPALINEVLHDPSIECNICDLIYKKYIQSGESWYEHLDPKDYPLTETGCAKSEVKILTYPLAIAMEFTFLIPYVILMFIIHRFNHVKIYACIMSTCAISLMLCCLVPQVTLATIFLALSICSGSCVSLISALTVEAFPTKLRALALCTMYMAGQLGSTFGICSVSLMEEYVCHVIFVMIAVLMILSVILLLKCWPDLIRVRSLMELKNFTY